MLVYIYNCLKKKEKKSEAVDKKYSGIGEKKNLYQLLLLNDFISFPSSILSSECSLEEYQSLLSFLHSYEVGVTLLFFPQQ